MSHCTIVLSDLLESGGYSSKALQKGSCTYALLDGILRYVYMTLSKGLSLYYILCQYLTVVKRRQNMNIVKVFFIFLVYNLSYFCKHAVGGK